MCGFVGLVSDRAAVETSQRVEGALRDLRHRGPDGKGLFLQPSDRSPATVVVPQGCRQLPAMPSDPGGTRVVALAHRRLAIIDPTPAADQPMVSADGRYVLVFNGEIYNYLELRAELAAHGEQFRTASDTEVLLTGYVRWGLRIFDRVVGMFALALFDRAAQTIVLARDPFGMKPLYYATSAHGFGFASEPRALLSLLGLDARADTEGLADYLVHGLTDHRAATMFDGVQALPPASHLCVSLATPTVSDPVVYWKPGIDRIDDRPPAVIVRDLRDCFLKSVQLHLRSAVQVGTLLSGGLDSSAIVMAMREVGGARLDICTFSFIPGAGAVSEERWIDEVNLASGAIPHKVQLSREDWESESEALAESQGEPFGTLAVHAQSALFRTASHHGLRVLLDGQGADEMLAGYTMFRGVRMAGHLRRREYRRAMRFGRALRGEQAPTRGVGAPYLDAARHLLPRSAAALARRLRRHGIVNDTWLRTHGVRPREAWRPNGPRALQERLRDAIVATSLPALLRYADRSAMMHGVESRLPFLTRELVEFALALPDDLLVSDSGAGKAIFREALRGLVPETVLNRRDKVGFAVPLREWLVGSRYAGQLVNEASGLPCVDGRRVRSWLDDLDHGHPPAAGRTFLLWRLIGLAAWKRRYNVSIA